MADGDEEPEPPASPQRTRLSAFESLSVRSFRYLFAGTVLAGFASWMGQVGQGWLVQQLTDSPLQLGLVQFLRGISVLVVSPLVGPLSDRVDRRYLASGATAANAISFGAMGLLIISGDAAMWQLYVTSLVAGTANSIFNPVRQHLVFDAVGEKHLTNAIALNSTANNLARVTGPGLAGFMLAYSVSSTFFAGAIFFLAATFSLMPVRVARVSQVQRESFLTGIRMGFRYMAQKPILLRLTLLQAITTVLVFPYTQLMPNITTNYLHVGPSGYGWMLTGVGIGSLVSGLVVASLSTIERKGAVSSLALLVYMGMVIAFTFSRTYFLSLGLLVVAGLGLVVFSTFNQTLLQLHVANEYRGRVLSLYTMTQGLNPFGGLLMGFIAEDVLGPPHAIALFVGIAFVLALLSGVASKEVRSL